MHLLSAIFTNGGLFPEKEFYYDLVQIYLFHRNTFIDIWA